MARNLSKLRCFSVLQLGRTMWTHIFKHMQTANAQIRLRICAADQGILWPFTESLATCTTECMNGEVRPGPSACAGWPESTHFAHVRMFFFRLKLSNWCAFIKHLIISQICFPALWATYTKNGRHRHGGNGKPDIAGKVQRSAIEPQ